MVSSSREVAAEIGRGLGCVGAVAEMAPNLGIDASGGRRRRAWWRRSTASKRICKMSRCKRRLRQLNRAVGDRNACKVFVAGPRAAATYGSEVWGLADNEVVALRRTAAAGQRPRGRLRSQRMVLLIAGMPTVVAEVAPMFQRGRMTWKAVARRQAAIDSGLCSPSKAGKSAEIYNGPKADSTERWAASRRAR